MNAPQANLVATWLRRDPKRLRAGILGGMVGGLISAVVAMAVSAATGHDAWFPVKLVATPVLGSIATEIGFRLGAILVGLALHEILSAFLGMIFSHFVYTNSLRPLLAMGLVWGVLQWIFVWNLFSQSFKPIFAAQIQSGAALLVCVTYGLSLVTIKFFDRAGEHAQ